MLSSDEPASLSFPTPREPLREWTEREIEPGVMIAAMESMIRIVKAQPDFEARRDNARNPKKGIIARSPRWSRWILWDSDFCILTSVFRPSVSTVPSVRACPPLIIIRSSHLGEVSSEHGSENRKESLYGVHLFRACGGKGRSPSSPVRGPRETTSRIECFRDPKSHK